MSFSTTCRTYNSILKPKIRISNFQLIWSLCHFALSMRDSFCCKNSKNASLWKPSPSIHFIVLPFRVGQATLFMSFATTRAQQYLCSPRKQVKDVAHSLWPLGTRQVDRKKTCMHSCSQLINLKPSRFTCRKMLSFVRMIGGLRLVISAQICLQVPSHSMNISTGVARTTNRTPTSVTLRYSLAWMAMEGHGRHQRLKCS